MWPHFLLIVLVFPLNLPPVHTSEIIPFSTSKGKTFLLTASVSSFRWAKMQLLLSLCRLLLLRWHLVSTASLKSLWDGQNFQEMPPLHSPTENTPKFLFRSILHLLSKLFLLCHCSLWTPGPLKTITFAQWISAAYFDQFGLENSWPNTFFFSIFTY